MLGLNVNKSAVVESIVQAMENSTLDQMTDATKRLSMKNFTLGQMPKRITMDNAEWARNIAKLYDKNYQMEYHGITPDLNFYFVVSVLTLALVAVLLLIYSYFCVWVLKVTVFV